MRPDAEFEAVQQLIRAGLNDCAISRETGINRRTICGWRHQGDRAARDSRGQPRLSAEWSRVGPLDCPICERGSLERDWYAYLLGLYLGDGFISAMPRGVFKLRVVLDVKQIIDECLEAMARMRTADRAPPSVVPKIGCVEVNAHWKHWPCLFPQHGPGRKHDRPIVLQWRQRSIVAEHPERLLRGLIHSDGCRDLNRVNGKDYPRYSFTNESFDIRSIFIDTCERLGVHWTTPTYKVISISRRADVRRIDRFIGPKTQPVPLAWITPGARADQLFWGLGDRLMAN